MRAADDAAEDPAADTTDTEAAGDQAASACITKCEAEHESCTAAAKTRADDCARQQAACNSRCGMCKRMYGPQVVYCVQDCEACRARLAASPCAKPAEDADCTRTLEACLERCGP